MLELNRIHCGDNCDLLGKMPRECVDLVVTSPPYDDLRTYGGHSWDFFGVAWHLRRVLKPGGVLLHAGAGRCAQHACVQRRRTMNWLRRLFCAHRYEWMRNIYGDEINLSGGKRSLWGCAECGKVQARDDLHDDGNLRGIAGPLPERGWD